MLPSSWISSFTSEINRRDMPHQRSATENSVPWREALHLCPALNPEALGQTLEARGKTFWRLKIIWNHAELSPLAFRVPGLRWHGSEKVQCVTGLHLTVENVTKRSIFCIRRSRIEREVKEHERSIRYQKTTKMMLTAYQMKNLENRSGKQSACVAN